MTPRPLKKAAATKGPNAAPKKMHKSKVPKRLLKSIISLDSTAVKENESLGNSAFDAENQRAPRRALDFAKYLSRQELAAASAHLPHDDNTGNERDKSQSSAKKRHQEKKNTQSSTTDTTATAFKVGKELTKKRMKKKDFHKKKQEMIRAKKEMGSSMYLEDILRLKGAVKHGERNEDIPKFTVTPRKVIKKELDPKLEQPSKPKATTHQPKPSVSNQAVAALSTETKVGRSRKLKSLPEAEKRALLQERDRIIALYRSKNNK